MKLGGKVFTILILTWSIILAVIIVGLFEVSFTRNYYQSGLLTVYNYIIIVCLMAVLILFITHILLKILILDRISLFKKQLNDINSMRNFSKNIIMNGNDEITDIINITNELLKEMDSSKKQLTSLIDLRNKDIIQHKINEETLSEFNKQMSLALNELKFHEREMSIINKMNELLQSCQNVSEAYSIIEKAAKELFFKITNVLAILNKNTMLLEVIGHQKNATLKDKFSPDDCWALRSGQVYIVDDLKSNLLCKHFNYSPLGGYMCIPLIVRNEVIGLISVIAAEKSMLTTSQQHLSITFCDVIKLSLANIKLKEAFREQSIRDKLTGLYNRRYLDETLPRELQRMKRENNTLSFIMLDLDHFKKFNDDYGHEAGDEVLKFIGNLLLNNFRGGDIACRFGGEEFAVILLGIDLNHAIKRMENICKKVRETKLFFQQRLLPAITVSIGIAQAPKDGSLAEDLIRAADEALYCAKQGGRDRIEVYSAKQSK